MYSSLDSFSQNSPRVALGQVATMFLLLGLWAAHVMLAQPAGAASPAIQVVQLASAAAPALSGSAAK